MYITPWSERVAVLADTMSMNDDAQRRAAELTDELKAVLKDLRSKVRFKLSDFSQLLSVYNAGTSRAREFGEDSAHGKARRGRQAAGRESRGTRSGAVHSSKARTSIHRYHRQSQQGNRNAGAGADRGKATAGPCSARLHTEQYVWCFTWDSLNKRGIAGLQSSTLDHGTTTFTGSLETSNLLSHIDGLRSSVRFLSRENSYLKSRKLVESLNVSDERIVQARAPLQDVSKRSEEQIRLRSNRLLWRETAVALANPKMVDLSAVKPGTNKWSKRSVDPEEQLLRQREALQALAKRVVNHSAESLPQVIRL